MPEGRGFMTYMINFLGFVYNPYLISLEDVTVEGSKMIMFMQLIECDEDKAKFEEIYSHYQRLMYFVAYKVVGNEADAEDAVQQAFVSIIENLDKIGIIDSPQTKSYVAIIAEHKAIDIVRAKKRFVELNEDITGFEIELPGDCGLADAMSKLPGRYREVLLLRYDNGYNTQEIAQILDMKRGTVQKLIWRAKEMLTKKMKEEA